uniref:Transposase (Putative), gypsy type n=1 Tax=Tanacetum cinerariifolium TaxID=118510 RepID=A0A6L2NN79_TANCI|nr:hypothetical protein [Tanacetum cinerariifolium]
MSSSEVDSDGAVDAATTADRVRVEPSLFGVGSSSTGRTDSVPDGFSDVSGSDFLIGGIRTVIEPDSDLQKVYVSQWSLFTEFNVGAARQISLSTEVRMRAEYNIREKRRLKSVVDEHAELIKVRDGEIENLKAQLLLKEAEAAEAIRLQAEVFKFEAIEKSLQGKVRVLRDHNATLEKEKNELSVKVTDLSASVKVREQEVADLDAQVIAVKLQNDNFVGQVRELEISSAWLQEKVAVFKDFIGQLEKFQDERMKEVNEKFNKLCADFVEMALHLEEKFYPHLLTTIFGPRWLLTHGMELAIVKCLNSTEYMSALGAAIRKAVEKGMQEGLSAGITHGAKGRKLADVAAYNPSAEADYLLRLTESHPHANQLMVPIHHSPANALLVLPLYPFPWTFLAPGYGSTSGSTHDTTTALSVTFVFACTISPISTDDYEVAHADGQEGASVDGETAVDENIDPFSGVSNAELNILE